MVDLNFDCLFSILDGWSETDEKLRIVFLANQPGRLPVLIMFKVAVDHHPNVIALEKYQKLSNTFLPACLWKF
jgi:hypothetical protein